MQLIATLSKSSREQIRIVKEVFATMMDLDVNPVDAPWHLHETNSIVSAVFFSMTWDGAILVECSIPLAFTLTERMMAVQRPAEIDENVSDAISELANMIGGNFKAIMPPETGLSVPMILRSGIDCFGQMDGSPLTNIVFDAHFGQCRLSLIATPNLVLR